MAQVKEQIAQTSNEATRRGADRRLTEGERPGLKRWQTCAASGQQSLKQPPGTN